MYLFVFNGLIRKLGHSNKWNRLVEQFYQPAMTVTLWNEPSA
ncbi:hypothetical protein BC751_2643 [Cecembia calidifontis]|uniref:Uncharacterized protein n=1 Tax=Cecembia calidifontis TaxID=1187080 RepID=A0A4Q7P9X4_9BACT|nr:hypothetical protein BC751_2643 [Cecembia calidifontis]